MMVSNQLKLSFTFILLLQILINSVVFVFVFEDIVLIFVKVNQYTKPTNQSFCLFVRWGPRGQEPSRFVILPSGQCVISAASGEEVCPRPTTELTCPKEERIRVLMKKSEYFSSFFVINTNENNNCS